MPHSLRGAVAAVVLATLLVASGHSQTNRNADLDRLRGEITRLRQRLDDVHRKARSAEQELEEVDLEIDIRTRELTIAIDGQRQLEEQQRIITDEISALTPRIQLQKTFLRKRMVALYRMGGLSYLRMFLAIDDRRNPVEAMSMLSYLVSRDSRAVSHFQQAQEELSLRKIDLAERQEKLKEVQKVVEARRRDVTASRAQKEKLIASLHAEESGSEKQLAEMEERARRLERLITTLSRQKNLPETSGATDVRAVQGALAWPAAGKVIERFGRQRNAKFSTVTTNNGVKIAAAVGSPVHAVFGGTVLFSQWFKGYGNLIIIDHGNRVFSLYGNVKAPSVGISDQVTAGQTIAGVGESEDVQSGYLYFEIRNDNKPEDPQKWLR
jgi:septal ring factor EnvC (AmiA/AmiB activator)